MTLDEFKKKAKECAELINKSQNILLVSHIDADGLSAAGIMCSAFERAHKKHEPLCVKGLNPNELKTIEDLYKNTANGFDLVVFTDLGSGFAPEIEAMNIPVIVADHHQQKASTLKYHLNPFLFGFHGSSDISGSGCAFMIAYEMNHKNVDLAAQAIVGAVGDLQDNKSNGLVGINKEIVDMGEKAGVIQRMKDLKLYGKQTRPLYKLLLFSDLPELGDSEGRCIEFIQDNGVPDINRKTWYKWINLKTEQKQMFINGLIAHCIDHDLDDDKIDRLLGESYILTKEEDGTVLRDASEFSTLLNATARYGYTKTGLAICTGKRGEDYENAKALLEDHRRNIVMGINVVKDRGINQLANLQWFHAEHHIRDTIVGIVAGMCTKVPGFKKGKAIIGFAYTEDGNVKVSARGTYDLVRRGLNLGKAISESSVAVGGSGGGHDVAAGAGIPLGKEREFLILMNEKIGEQLKDKNTK